MGKIWKCFFLVIVFCSCSKSNDSENVTICGNAVDLDGNVYESVTIGSQCWMSKNLNVSKYRNGDLIPQVESPMDWQNMTTGAWCYANNDPVNEAVYGKLYNWFAVNDPRGLAPEGWHGADKDEWTSLISHIGGYEGGGKLKEIGTEHWFAPNVGATDEYGFHAVGHGFRSYSGKQFWTGDFCYFWTATEYSSEWISSYFVGLTSGNKFISVDRAGKPCGMAVRCVRN